MEPTEESKNITNTNTTTANEATTVESIDKDAAIVTGQDGDQPVTVVMNPPKKHKVGIIVSIVVFLLVLIGGGSLAAWYFCIYNSPDVIAYDAVRQLISAEHVATTGSVRVADSEADADGNVNVAELQFSTSSANLPSNTSVSLSISERDRDNQIVDNHEVSVDLGFAVMADGVVYFQVEHLVDTLDKALDAQDLTLEDLGDMAEFAYAIVELIDNQWWQISVTDIFSELDFDSSIYDPVNDFYTCVLAAAQERTDLAKLYDAHRFIKITKSDQAATTSGTTRYQVELDHAALADYINALPKTAGAEKAIVCYNEFADEFDLDHVSVSDLPTVSAKQLEKALPSGYHIYLEISNFGHQLKRIEVEGSTSDVKISGDLTFDYSAVGVTVPSDYRPITDLFEEIFELVGEYFYGLGDFIVDQDTGIMVI